jgi:hypothetical protein
MYGADVVLPIVDFSSTSTDRPVSFVHGQTPGGCHPPGEMVMRGLWRRRGLGAASRPGSSPRRRRVGAETAGLEIDGDRKVLTTWNELIPPM